MSLRCMASVVVALSLTAGAGLVFAQAPDAAKSPDTEEPRDGSEPTDDNKARARALFISGDEKFRADDFKGALADFEAADAIMMLPTTGTEVGRTLAKIGRLIEAREKLARVANLLPRAGEIQAQVDARAEARVLLKRVEAQIPSIRVRLTTSDGADPENVVVEVDGRSLRGAAALEPRRVNPGAHTVAVQAHGYRRVERAVQVKRSTVFALDIELKSASLPSFESEPKQAAAQSDVATTISVVLFAVGGASMVVGFTTAAFTLLEADELESRCPDKRCAPADADQLDKTVALSHISTGTLVAGAVLMGAGVISLLLSGDESDLDEHGRREKTVRPFIGIGYLGLEGIF